MKNGTQTVVTMQPVGFDKNYWVRLNKNLKNTASVFRVFDLLFIHIKPYESKLSTALSECKAVARCATRKTDTAINRIKNSGDCRNVVPLETHTAINRERVGTMFMSNHFKKFLSPHIPYKLLEYVR